ncbi:hypothetical protein G9A89_007517 [Geosiphon pyriformis]|nr:hypothetical protein G9A89_007517 [Geosiphon pyriformis]
MSDTGAKKRSTRVPTSSSVGSDSSYKIKIPPGGVKLSSKGVVLKGNRSGQVIRQSNSIDTDEKASESEEVSDFKINTPQAKCFNNSAIIGSLLGSINYDMEEEEEVFLSSHKSFSLDKAWIDPKIIRTQVEVAVKKSFTLDINLSAVEKKSTTTKTQVIRKLFSGINGFGGATTSSKFEEIIRSTFTSEASMEKAASLAKNNNIIVNSDLKRQGFPSDQAVVIKKIPIDMPKEMIVTTVSEFGQVAVAEGCNGVCRIESGRSTSRDRYKALLFTLLVETMAYDLGNLLAGAGEKTCVINRFLDTGNRVHCAVVCFENDKILESAFCMEPIFGGVKLFWARLDLVRCKRCGKLGHFVLKCDAEISTSPKLFKSFKRVVSDENCLQLAKLYVKKSVVSLVSLSNGPHFGSGSGFGFSFGASDVVGYSSLVVPVNSFLETCLISLEHFLELLTDKVSGIVNKLDNLNLVPMALVFSSQPLVILVTANVEFGSDMVLNDPKPVVFPPFSVSSGVSNLGSSSSKILTSKMNWLELKLMALKVSVCSVLEKLD